MSEHGSSDSAIRPGLGINLEPSFFEPMDRFRRELGVWLDRAGLGPEESPFRTVLSEPGLTLRNYDPEPRAGPVLLIVPAPIKRAYIWDLLPQASVVRRGLENGLSVYLAYWEHPGRDGRSFGLADYAERFML